MTEADAQARIAMLETALIHTLRWLEHVELQTFAWEEVGSRDFQRTMRNARAVLAYRTPD